MKKGIMITFDQKYKVEGKLQQQLLKKCENWGSADSGVQFLIFKTLDGRKVMYKTEDIFAVAEVEIPNEAPKKAPKKVPQETANEN